MGSLFRILDIQEDTMGKKAAAVTHKRLVVGGLEAPRNSLELPLETSYGLYSGRDNILYDYHMSKELSEMSRCSTEGPIKKLIGEDISSKQNSRQSAPSVVARLMGVDMLPFDSKSAQPVDIKSETPVVKFLKKEQSEKSSNGHVPSSTLNSSERLDFGFCGYNTDRYSDQRGSHKPKPRQHPQEEELQKFKKEFEAWQAARIKECSKVVEFSSAPSQLIAQEDLNREKLFLYANSRKVTTSERPMEPKDRTVIPSSYEKLTPCKKKNDQLLDEAKESIYSSRRSSTDYTSSRFMKYDNELDNFSAPTKIVILRPGPDRMGMSEDSWSSTPSSSEERGSIVDFLEEVKERLKSELQGKSSKRTSTVRGGGIETPFREKPSDPRQIAQRIAQQVRDSVTRDLGMNLLRSASTRSYRSDIQLNSTGSPEFINKDTRRLLTERLKNVLKAERYPEVPTISHYNSKSSLSGYNKARAGQSKDIGTEDKWDQTESIASELENRSISFRREPDEGQMIHEETSPRNLVRSLSAPVSGTSFGKLLLEDRHILTGAQIRRKHEVLEKVSMNGKKQKKDKFNIREKVSSFRYNLTLRGMLFRRRVQSVGGSPHNNKHDLLNDISSGPTVMMSFYETHENSTEVPPSPASVCSTVQEEFWRSAGYSSPTSSLGVHQMEENEAPQVFKEINSNLNELRRKLNELQSAVPPYTITEHQPDEVEIIDIEDQAEAYARDLLVASGLYDTSCNQSLSKWDPLGKPISNQVFEEVEESHRESCEKSLGETAVNHKILLDLLNEALPCILKPCRSMSRYVETVKWSMAGMTHEAPQGRNLLSRVWEMIRVYVYPPEGRLHYTLDNMVSRDLSSNPWSGCMDDDLFALGRDVECLIIGDLIYEMVKDMLR